MRIRLSAAELARIRGSWPTLCCGCGRPPTTTSPAWIRRSGAVAVAAGLTGGDARWTTFSLPLPACAGCAARARWLPPAWGAVAVALFAGGLWAMQAGLHYEADGTPVEGLARTIRLTLFAGFALAVFLGVPLFLVLQRRSSPALISDLQGPTWETLESVELDCGSADFARAVDRLR